MCQSSNSDFSFLRVLEDQLSWPSQPRTQLRQLSTVRNAVMIEVAFLGNYPPKVMENGPGFWVDVFPIKNGDYSIAFISLPECKWLGSPPFISHETPIWNGNNPT